MHSCCISALYQLYKWKHKFTPGSSGVGLGGDILKNGHLNQHPVVAGLLVVK